MLKMFPTVCFMVATAAVSFAAEGPAYLAGAQNCNKLIAAYQATWQALDAGKSEKEADAIAAKVSGLNQATALSASTVAKIDRNAGAGFAAAVEHYRQQCQ